MVRADVTAATLADLYLKLREAQEAAHGPHYCLHHDVITRLAGECSCYTELGVNQGTTLACAILAGYEGVWGVDADLKRLEPHTHLFESAWLFEQDSRVPLGSAEDILFIDSRHEPEHMREELRVHGPAVTSYILAHDTATFPALHRELVAWCHANKGWAIAEREMRGPGFTLLRRQ